MLFHKTEFSVNIWKKYVITCTTGKHYSFDSFLLCCFSLFILKQQTQKIFFLYFKCIASYRIDEREENFSNISDIILMKSKGEEWRISLGGRMDGKINKSFENSRNKIGFFFISLLIFFFISFFRKKFQSYPVELLGVMKSNLLLYIIVWLRNYATNQKNQFDDDWID